MESRARVVRSRSQRRYIPQDLWPNILCRLPAKSLLRFRCVSPAMQTMIEDPEFRRLHKKMFKGNSKETHLLVVHGRRRKCTLWRCDTFEPDSDTLLTLEEPGERWQVVFSIHGLVVLGRNFDVGTTGWRDLVLWNPSIRKFHEIPPLPGIEVARGCRLITAELGLGYDSVADEYKYIRILYVDQFLHTVAVYTLGTTSCWRLFPCVNQNLSRRWDPTTIGWKARVYIEGCLYFVPRTAFTLMDGVPSTETVRYRPFWELVRYNVSSEDFTCIRLPNDPFFKQCEFKWQTEIALIDNGSALAVLDIYSPRQKTLWVFGPDGDGSMSWKKRCSFHLNFKKFLCFWRSGELLSRSSRKRDGVRYDEVGSFVPEARDYMIVKEKRASLFLIYHVAPYSESLVMLK